MANQSKTPFEAEIDLAELVDFWRFNAYYMQFLYEQQPDQAPGEVNRLDWRPLEGFVLAIPPCDVVLNHPALAGLHFTGSYETLVRLWQQIAQNLPHYKSFPRIVGETGGKDFIFVHPSADPEEVVANTLRGAFEYQGQKCSAASRMYVPESLWPTVKQRMLDELPKLKVGPVEDLSVFMGAIITQDAYEKIVGYIEHAKQHPEEYEIVYGGEYRDRNMG